MNAKKILFFAVVIVLYLGLVALGALLTGAGHGTGLFMKIALSPFGLIDSGWGIVGGVIFWFVLVLLIQKK